MTHLPRKPPQMKRVPAPWEKQLNETDKAWEAFQVFRNLGADRSIENTSKALKKSPQQLYVWKHKYRWMERVTEWDNEVDKEMRSGLVKERIKTRLSLLKFGRNITGLSWKRLNKMVEEQKENPDVPIITKDELLKFAQLGFKMERLALGEPDVINEIKIDGNDTDVERIIADPKLLALALQIDEALGTGETEPFELDDDSEPDMGEGEPSETTEQ